MAEHAHSTNTPAVDRRRLGAGLFATIIGGGITAGAAVSVADLVPRDPDADLITICTRAEAIDNRSIALMDAVDDLLPSDPKWSPAVDEAARLFSECKRDMDRVAGIPAATPDGLRAKASLALREMTETDFDDCPLVFSVLSQVAGRA